MLTNSYKDTPIGPLPNEWGVASFPDTVLNRRINVGKVKRGEYLPYGTFPIIDQSQDYIAGYSNDEPLVYKDELPVVIFGDHTRVFKYVDFPFICGADGTKVLLPNKELVDPEYYYYCLSNLDIPSKGYNRHFKLLKEQQIPLPPPPEQRAIAHVLSIISQAIEATERVIASARELKRSMMKHLFTYGPVPIDQASLVSLQETEIGEVPERWRIENLGEFLDFIRNGTTKKQNREGRGYPVTRIETISEDRINPLKVGYVLNISPEEVEKYQLSERDILFSNINSEPQIGRSVVYEGFPKKLLHGMNLLCLRTSSDLNPYFLSYLFSLYRSRGIFIGIAARAVNQSSINQGKMKALTIPIPRMDEQLRIPVMSIAYSR